MEFSFIVGIGSQRAGSTLIARLLNQHPKIAIHPLKELHYFDTVFDLRDEKVLQDFSKNQLDREINRLCNAERHNYITPSWQWYLRTNYQLYTTPTSQINYSALFDDVYRQKGIDEIEYVGESTPEYMLLDKSQIEKMKSIIGDAYIIIICRNPVKRIVSSFRLLIEYGRQNKSMTQEQCDRLFLDLIDKNDVWIERQMMYNEYKQAVENYRSQFNNVLFLSYDEVVEAPAKLLQQISQFLKLDFKSQIDLSFFDKKINSLSIKYKPGKEVFDSLNNLTEKQNKEISQLFGKPLIY